MTTYFLLHDSLLCTINYPASPNDPISNILRRNTLVLDLNHGSITARRYTPQPALLGWDIRYARDGHASFFSNRDLTLLLPILPYPLLAHELLCRDEGRFSQEISSLIDLD